VRGVALIGLVALAACGDGQTTRAFDLEIRGMSARADSLVLKLRGPTKLTPCRDIDLSNVADLDFDEERRWQRSEGAERAFELPALEVDAIVLVAYSNDAAGTPIQIGCQQFSYEDLGNLVGGGVVLTLTARVP